MDMKSLDFSLPIRQFIVRCEIAEYFGEAKNVKPDMDDIGWIRRNTTNVLVGVDWYPGHDWTLTSQYSHKIIHSYAEELESEQNTAMAILGLTKTF